MQDFPGEHAQLMRMGVLWQRSHSTTSTRSTTTAFKLFRVCGSNSTTASFLYSSVRRDVASRQRYG